MCGIAGLVGAEATRESLGHMLTAIAHRGPDDAGTYLDHGVAIGMRRLSIIDLSGGHQPMLTPDGRYAIVFNGEIYNYVELAAMLRQRGIALRTQSDTEVILRLFEADGEPCVHHLRGMFALAVWDRATRRLFLARDRLGKKPLYYGWVGRTFVFMSELKAARSLPGVDLALDPIAVDEYFTYRYVPDPRTIFRCFQKLPPGHCLLEEGGHVKLWRYWRPDFAEQSQLNLDEAEEEFARGLDEAVALRLRADVPVGAFLSGGLDSSVVVSLMARHVSRPVQTFSVGWRSHDSVDELGAARTVAELFSTQHYEVVVEPPGLADLIARVVWHLDEPLADPAALPTLVLSGVASQHVKVVLCGEGADELFGGYPYLHWLQWFSSLPPRPAPLRALSHLVAERMPRTGIGRPFGRVAELLGADPAEALKLTLSVFRSPERRRLLAPMDVPGCSIREQSRSVNDLLEELTLSWLPGDLLMKVDKMTMAASLEARAPFLDHCLFELVGGLPGRFKVRGRVSKLLLRRAARRWLPADVARRRKRGFGVPIDAWLRGDLRPLLQETLQRARLQDHGLFDVSEVERLMARHQRGADVSLQLWTLFNFQLWYDRFSRTGDAPKDVPGGSVRLVDSSA